MMVDSDTMRGTISALQAENDQLKEQLANQKTVHETPQDDTTELKKKSEEYDQLKSDYEDLLVLLEDQDAKILSLKSRLKEHGVELDEENEEVEEEESEEEDSEESDALPNGEQMQIRKKIRKKPRKEPNPRGGR